METRIWQALILAIALSSRRAASLDAEDEFAEARVGSDAELPCSLEPLHAPDKVGQVVWRRGDDETEIYKYDLRSARPDHKVDPSLVDRFFMRVVGDESAVLTIAHIGLADEATYHCRVDFHRSPARITHVNLTVIGECKFSTCYRSHLS